MQVTCELCGAAPPWLVWEPYGRFCRPCATRLRCARHLPDHELRFIEFAAREAAAGRHRLAGNFTALRRAFVAQNLHLPAPTRPLT